MYYSEAAGRKEVEVEVEERSKRWCGRKILVVIGSVYDESSKKR